MIHKAEEKNRRDLTVGGNLVTDTLPDWFTEDNSKLITLLEKYYEYMDSDATYGFATKIRDLHHVRDTQEVDEAYLDEIIKEIGNGLQKSAFFENPRLMAKLLGEFYRVKGTPVSVEGFFRGFFGTEVTIEYPKDKIFIVNQSHIGYDSQRFIIDNKLYQTFSILIKVGLSVQDYEELYKRFVHPAGFYFAGEVQAQGVADLSILGLSAVDSDEIRSVRDLSLQVGGVATATFEPIVQELTVLIQDSDQTYRAQQDQLFVSDWTSDSSITANSLSTYYSSIVEMITPNSFTFDDSEAISPRTCMTIETMDNDMFTRYSSNILDSTI